MPSCKADELLEGESSELRIPEVGNPGLVGAQQLCRHWLSPPLQPRDETCGDLAFEVGNGVGLSHVLHCSDAQSCSRHRGIARRSVSVRRSSGALARFVAPVLAGAFLNGAVRVCASVKLIPVCHDAARTNVPR